LIKKNKAKINNKNKKKTKTKTVLLVAETGRPGENHLPVVSH
jgi:hypothetical protein